jgi:hypothetical protein
MVDFSLFSAFTDGFKLAGFTRVGEKYGVTIGKELNNGASLNDAVRTAYLKHGIIAPAQFRSGGKWFIVFMGAIGDTVSGYGHELGFLRHRLKETMLELSKEMWESADHKIELDKQAIESQIQNILSKED